jgi:predicted DNA-binding protein (MmcQ/YjbR family)
MDLERMRDLLRELPHVEETVQWGDNLVFWAGDKAIGGKMFALANLEDTRRGVAMFAAGAERFNELIENEGVVPAPYMARIYWVALQRWDALPAAELIPLLEAAYNMTFAKLPPRTKAVLAMPVKERRKLIGERRKLLAARAREEKAAKTARAAEDRQHEQASKPGKRRMAAPGTQPVKTRRPR